MTAPENVFYETSNEVTMHRTDLIIAALEEKGWTHERLAAEAEISRPTVSAIVHGKTVTLESLNAAAKALGIPLADLFTEPTEAAA